MKDITCTMSGRSRGRGQRHTNLESLGIKPGDNIPPPILQPPPTFPPLERKPLDLSNTSYYQALLVKKQDLEQSMKELPFYLKAHLHKEDIARYSDKYKLKETNSIQVILNSIPNWKMTLPKELHLERKIKKKTIENTKKPKLTIVNQSKDNTLLVKPVLANELDLLGEQETSEEPETTGANSDDQKEEDEYYDEEFEEEEGDYQLTYFDPGDDLVGDDEDNLDETGGSYY